MLWAVLATGINNLEFLDSPWGQRAAELSLPPAGFESRHCEREDSVAFQGLVKGQPTVLVYSFTPFTKRLWEVTLIIGNPQRFKPARNQYIRYRNALIDAYGKPSHSYEFVSNPYWLGDNRQEEALHEGKYNLSDFWMNNPTGILGMAITPEGWTCITYDSRQFSRMAREEYNLVR